MIDAYYIMALFGKEIIMSEKRRDSKNRVLQNGESQCKDGKYVDANRTRRSAYSWKLVATDKVPEGKRCELSLREMEKQIRRDLEDGISTHTANSVNAFIRLVRQFLRHFTTEI